MRKRDLRVGNVAVVQNIEFLVIEILNDGWLKLRNNNTNYEYCWDGFRLIKV